MSPSRRPKVLATGLLALAACRGTQAEDPPVRATTTVTAERTVARTAGSEVETSKPPEPASSARAIPLVRFASGDEPVYPEMSRRLHEEGTVELEFGLRDDGSVVALAIARSSGHRRLDEAALEAARAWRFHPRTGGGGVERIRHRVRFQLTD